MQVENKFSGAKDLTLFVAFYDLTIEFWINTSVTSGYC